MRYILDNDMTYHHAEVLRMYDVDVRALREEFGQEAKDSDWIPAVGRKGWVLVSGDRHIRTKPPELLALKKSGVTALFFGSFWKKLGFKREAAWLLSHWDQIDEQTQKLRPGSSAKIQQNGRLVPYPL